MLFYNLVAGVSLGNPLENNHIWDHFSIFDTLLTFFVKLTAIKMKICRLCVITAEDSSGGGLSDGGAADWGHRGPIGMRARKKVLLYMG